MVCSAFNFRHLLTLYPGCNVGYAFVNFIQVEDLLLFAKKRLGQKWHALRFSDLVLSADFSSNRNMFSSEKVLQMSYANYQYVPHT